MPCHPPSAEPALAIHGQVEVSVSCNEMYNLEAFRVQDLFEIDIAGRKKWKIECFP